MPMEATWRLSKLKSVLKDKPDTSTRMRVLYEWVKTSYINYKEFIYLIETRGAWDNDLMYDEFE